MHVPLYQQANVRYDIMPTEFRGHATQFVQKLG
jgi:hypothetical protein